MNVHNHPCWGTHELLSQLSGKTDSNREPLAAPQKDFLSKIQGGGQELAVIVG